MTTGAGTLLGTLSDTAVGGVADFGGKGLAIDTVGSDKVLTFTTTGGVITNAATVSGALVITAASARFSVATGNWSAPSTWATTSNGTPGALAPGLRLELDPLRPDRHGLVGPREIMPLAEWRKALAATRESWSLVEEPKVS